MRRRHGRATQTRRRAIAAANVTRQHTHTGSEDIHARAVVREGRCAETRICGGDGEGVGCVCGGLRGYGEWVAVLVAVAGCDHGEHVLRVRGLDGVCPRGRCAAAEGEVDDGFGGAGFGCDVADGPVEASQDRGCGSCGALEDFDGDEVGLFGNAVGAPADCAGDVGTVAERVGVRAANGVVTEGCAAAELAMGDQDAGVDDVGVCVLPGGGVVDV